MTDDHNNGETDLSRRKFLKNSGIFAGGVVGGSLLGGLLTNQFKGDDKQVKDVVESLQDARVYVSRDEDFAVLSAATERIFPKDDHGPGAIELGVPYFIDKQLNGSWGTNAREYMRDPFYHNENTHDYQHKDTVQDKSGPNTETQAPTPTPRYQSRLDRGEIIIQGLRTMNDVSQEKFGDKYTNLDGEQQDEILQMFENSEVDMTGVAAVTFFNLLLQLTVEGAYADPVYGGNKNMMGWKMKEYPGPRMSYINEIEQEEFIVMDQKSLRDYQAGGA